MAELFRIIRGEADAIPSPTLEIAKGAEELAARLAQHDDFMVEMAQAGAAFHEAEAALSRLKAERAGMRDPAATTLAAITAQIAEAECLVAGAAEHLISLGVRAAPAVAEIAALRGELASQIEAELSPLRSDAERRLERAIAALECSWVELHALAEAGGLAFGGAASVRLPLGGGERLANERLLAPRVDAAVGALWRSVRSALRRAERLA